MLFGALTFMTLRLWRRPPHIHDTSSHIHDTSSLWLKTSLGFMTVLFCIYDSSFDIYDTSWQEKKAFKNSSVALSISLSPNSKTLKNDTRLNKETTKKPRHEHQHFQRGPGTAELLWTFALHPVPGIPGHSTEHRARHTPNSTKKLNEN